MISVREDDQLMGTLITLGNDHLARRHLFLRIAPKMAIRQTVRRRMRLFGVSGDERSVITFAGGNALISGPGGRA